MGVFDFLEGQRAAPASTSEKKLSKAEQEQKVVDRATIEGMEQFSMLPFAFVGRKLNKDYHGHPQASIDLDRQNISAAKIELEKLNEFIARSHNLSELIPEEIKISIDDIVYKPYKKEHGYSKLICTPYTATGKLSKYPLTFFFMTRLDGEPTYRKKGTALIPIPSNKSSGKIVYAKDGQAATAKVSIWIDGVGFFYEFKTIGRTFLISKIKSTIKTDEKGLPSVIFFDTEYGL